MPANDRAPSTQFYWRDWLGDPAVLAMTWPEKAHYFNFLAMTYQDSKPGVCTEEQVKRWARYSDRQWPAHREAIARAFQIRKDGMWIQKRCVRDSKAQRKRFRQSQKGGRASARRPRSSLGHLEPRLDRRLEAGLGSPSSSSSTSSSNRRKPTSPPPAERPHATAPRIEGDNGRGAHRDHGPEAVSNVLARAMPDRSGCTAIPNGTGFTDALIAKQQRRFPDIDVFHVAMTVAEDVRKGGVIQPVALLVHRCNELRAEAARRRAAESTAASSNRDPLQSPQNEVEPRGVADLGAASPAPHDEGHHEEE